MSRGERWEERREIGSEEVSRGERWEVRRGERGGGGGGGG